MTASFAHSAGPPAAHCVIVGEAWGETESKFLPQAKPFVGESGKELFRLLFETWSIDPELEMACLAQMSAYGHGWVSLRDRWLAKADILCTNVLALRPPDNKIEALCSKKGDLPHDYALPPIRQGHYLRPQYLPELSRLRDEVLFAPRNLVIALGATSTWALLHNSGIGSIRGVTSPAIRTFGEVKVLPTYHPAAVLRNWSWRPIVSVDLMKARREAQFAEIRRPARTVITNPTIEECEAWANEVFSNPPPVLSCDIETGAGQIKCVGFAKSKAESLVIPFVALDVQSGSYWPDMDLERRAWRIVRALLESDIPKLGQNFLYDIQYLIKNGIRPRNCLHDTMLLHHSLYPELNKGLGFLGSIYTDEAAWKLMRRQKVDSEKRDE